MQVCECAYAKAEAKIPEDLKAEFTQTGDVTKHSQKLRDFLTPLKGECFGEMMTKAMNEQAKAVACSFRFAFYDENGKEISNGVTSNENMKTVEDCQKKCKARTEEEPMDWPFEKGARSIKGKCLFQGKDAGDYSHSRPAR